MATIPFNMPIVSFQHTHTHTHARPHTHAHTNTIKAPGCHAHIQHPIPFHLSGTVLNAASQCAHTTSPGAAKWCYAYTIKASGCAHPLPLRPIPLQSGHTHTFIHHFYTHTHTHTQYHDTITLIQLLNHCISPCNTLSSPMCNSCMYTP